MSAPARRPAPLLLAAACACALLAALPRAAGAQVAPRWSISGRGVLTSNLDRLAADRDPRYVLIDFADTSLTTRFARVLFDEGVVAFALGMRLTDHDSPVGPVFIRQVAAGLHTQHLMIEAGRGRRPVIALDYPTLRDEDLLTTRFPLNPFSTAGIEEDILFSEHVSITARADMRWHARLFLEALRDTLASGDPAQRDTPRPNAAGLRLYYDELPELSKVVWVKHAGLGLYGQRRDAGFDGPEGDDDEDELLWQLQGAASVNLYPDPIHLLDLRADVLYQHGPTGPLPSTAAALQARSIGGAAALRYLYAPYRLERFQAAISGGARQLTGPDALVWQLIPTALYRVASGVDLGAQYIYTHRDPALARAMQTHEDTHLVQLTLVYDFGMVSMNNNFLFPRTILDADYQYVPRN